MKHTKMIAIAMIATTIIGYTSAVQAVSGNFELYNKSKEGVDIEITYGSDRKKLFVNPGQQVQATIASNQPVYLTIRGRASNNFSKWELDANGKTKYVTYNPGSPKERKAVYPQTGPLMGIMGKTESGLSLKNNISLSNISEFL